MTDQSKDQPAESRVEGDQPSGHDPEEAVSVEPEERSGSGAGTATWECLTCGRVYDEDLGTCPDDGRPLRKVGPHATPQVMKVAHSDDNIERPASRPEDTPEGYDGAKEATRGEEPAEGQLQGEQAAPPRGPGKTSGL